MHRSTSAVLVAVALLTSGCATRAAVSGLRTDVRALRVELEALRADAARARDQLSVEMAPALGRLHAIDARTAALETNVRDTTTEVARLRGRLDTVVDLARETRAAPSARSAMIERSASLERYALVESPPAPAAIPAIPRVAERPPRQAAPPAPEAVYASALATFRSGQLGQAVLEFLEFLAANPAHPLSPNARYWIGEAYFAERDFRQALVEFHKVLDFGPTSKTADALLKVGLCQQRLHDGARAQQIWQQLLREYPRSTAAARARTLLPVRAVRPGP